MKLIELIEIIRLEGNGLSNSKVHLACNTGDKRALDVFVEDKKKWLEIIEIQGSKSIFNNNYILLLIQFYPQKDIWLFGGYFKVTNRHDVKLTKEYEEYIGRLKIHYVRKGGSKSISADKYFEFMTVSELLPNVYSGEDFPGYEKINHDFEMLESIFKRELTNWYVPLRNIKGVYLITDRSNGCRYIGSAYGHAGIWSRWNEYIKNGHGNNDKLIKLLKKDGVKYARENFIFTLLEYRSMKTDDAEIIARESYWKEVLLTRSEYGYNRN